MGDKSPKGSSARQATRTLKEKRAVKQEKRRIARARGVDARS
jgi:hypothetical protein